MNVGWNTYDQASSVVFVSNYEIRRRRKFIVKTLLLMNGLVSGPITNPNRRSEIRAGLEKNEAVKLLNHFYRHHVRLYLAPLLAPEWPDWDLFALKWTPILNENRVFARLR